MMEFVDDSISLDIPMPDGVNVEEWNIVPLVPPMVSKHLACTCLYIQFPNFCNYIVAEEKCGFI